MTSRRDAVLVLQQRSRTQLVLLILLVDFLSALHAFCQASVEPMLIGLVS